jgi:4-amino-4-deoxy-L-arabinose transferase-like glycosyltransferase
LAYPLLVLTFVFAGLTGHDPWKADEAYVFGVVQHMLQSSDWIVPTLAGEPFMEKPPLYYWVAAGFSYVLSPWLPLHDGARLASGALMLVNLWTVAATTRAWWGHNLARYAVLTLVACLGMVVQSHTMMPDVSLLTGFALTAFGFATILRRPGKGGVLIGVGIGIGFLSKGLLAPGVIVITALVLPMCFREWRTRAYWNGLILAAFVSLPFCVIWPVALYLRSPDLFMEWFWQNNIGRFVGFSVWRLRTAHEPWLWTQTIPWFTFPGLPLALWTLWRRRSSASRELPVQYSLVAFSVLMLTLAVSSSGREVYAWPLLIPVSLLAAQGAVSVPNHIDRVWSWASCALFGSLSAAIWTVWAWMTLTGAPPRWPLLLHYLPGDFAPRFNASSMLLGLLLTIGAPVVLRVIWKKPGKGLAVWVLGLTLTWSLLMTLWEPWLDYAKSYRSLFSSMPLPATPDCIASIDLGEGERAMLHYVTGFDPVRREVAPKASCTLLLIQREAAFGEPAIDRNRWEEVWRGKRPGQKKERFWVFRTTGRPNR